MPRQPHARIVLAAIFTVSIGGLFLAGNRGVRPGASVSTAPADRRVVAQPPALNIQAPPAQVALPSLGRDPFAGNRQKETKPAQPLTSGDLSLPVVPATSTNAGSVTSSVGAAVGVSVPTSAPAVGSVVKNTVSTVTKTVSNTTGTNVQPTAPTDPVSNLDPSVPSVGDEGAATADDVKSPADSSPGRKAGHYRSTAPEIYLRSKDETRPRGSGASASANASKKRSHGSSHGSGAAPRSRRRGHGHAYGWNRWNATCDPNARPYSHTGCWR
ncbi:MAG TPA: hypothetical protein VF660_01340 [Actinomycetota bacterium]